MSLRYILGGGGKKERNFERNVSGGDFSVGACCNLNKNVSGYKGDVKGYLEEGFSNSRVEERKGEREEGRGIQILVDK